MREVVRKSVKIFDKLRKKCLDIDGSEDMQSLEKTFVGPIRGQASSYN
jgi:hypothetical protein